MMLFCWLLALGSLSAGAFFYHGYALRWVRAWQNMTDAEKAQVNILPLCRNASIVFFAAGAIFGLAGASAWFLAHTFTPCMVLWIVGTGIDIFYIGKSGKFLNR